MPTQQNNLFLVNKNNKAGVIFPKKNDSQFHTKSYFVANYSNIIYK